MTESTSLRIRYSVGDEVHILRARAIVEAPLGVDVDTWVTFSTSDGIVSMPRERIITITAERNGQ